MDGNATLLKVLLRQRHLQRYETFCVEYEKAALQIAPDEVAPSKAQYYRWLSGHLKGGMPYPDACRVLESMFPPWTATDLLGPYVPGRPVVGSNQETPAGNLLETVPHSFNTDTLQGAWLTCYQFSRPPKCHADIAHLTAESDRRVRVRNYPPAPRTEGHATPFYNKIEAQLVNRHLIGHWKNIRDTRYFGALHLAVLPGETVMEGYYTGFVSDVDVGTAFWKWVRLQPESLAGADLARVTLREPAELHALVKDHSQYDAPLALGAVGEDS
ncbi:MAG: hypothetical protein J2P32_03445 [Actinobacteria bacterium]|nr:hypothetical protein [Actinomycetota bacterium]